METINLWLAAFSSFVWGPPLVGLLLGGGAILLIYSLFLPYRFVPHAVGILLGRNPEKLDHTTKGQLSHASALSLALAGTIGMGNIAGVAAAIKLGGPGAIFWMWMTAVVGIATKFFTGTLATMYRGTDDQGESRGGPMYVIEHGLGPQFKPLAWLFCIAGLIGCLPALQVNQIVETTETLILTPAGISGQWVKVGLGLLLAAAVASVIFSGIKRIGAISLRVVPLMCAIYLVAVSGILIQHLDALPAAFASIFQHAFQFDAAGTGIATAVIIIGVRRGLFSNEAGIGTEVMAHGTAQTKEPIREGMVAMLGPIIDTLIVCTATAMVLLVTGVATSTDLTGASLTAEAFSVSYGQGGVWLLYGLVLAFGFTTMTSYWFYGAQCAVYLAGSRAAWHYRNAYLLLIVFIALLPMKSVLNLIDGMYALMAIPTMTATLLLAPKVMAALRMYRQKLAA